MALGDFDSRWKNPQGADAQLMYLWAQDLIRELRKGDYISNAISDGIANSELADMAAWTIKMRNSATAGDPQDVTINGLTEETVIDTAADFVPIWDTGGGVMRKAKPENISPPPDVVLLNSGTVTNQATLDVVLTSFTAYPVLKFFLSSFVPANDDQELWMRFSTDGGANYDAGASDYQWVMTGLDSSGNSLATNDAADSEILIAGSTVGTAAISNVTNEGGADVEVTLHDQTATRFSRVRYSTGFYLAVARTGVQSGAGGRLTAQDTDAVRFLFETGNIASGKWALYGFS